MAHPGSSRAGDCCRVEIELIQSGGRRWWGIVEEKVTRLEKRTNAVAMKESVDITHEPEPYTINT